MSAGFMSLLGFSLIILAAHRVGEFFTRFNLPLISGYLFAGIIAGPFILDFVHEETIEDLRFLDETSLAIIAFAAGSELNPKELSKHYRSIAWHVVGQVVAIMGLVTTAVILISPHISFLREFSSRERLAGAILVGAIMVARSPSSAIAVVNELRARGRFTRIMLGVTITMDVVVVILFAVSTAIADIVLTASALNPAFALLVILEIGLSVFMGLFLASLIRTILLANIHHWAKIGLVLFLGYATFEFANNIRVYTHTHLDFEVLLEPLLICMIAGFVVTNYTATMNEFQEIIEDISPFIYVIFFTLVGDALQLDILVDALGITILIFLVRVVGLFLGSYFGGWFAREPIRYRRLGWMAYITQAGIGLGLAREAVAEFPELGNELATLIVSVIVVSQLVGPPFINYLIRHLGEANIPVKHQPDEIRDAVILGIDHQSVTLADELTNSNWKVTLIDTQKPPGVASSKTQVECKVIESLNRNEFAKYVTSATDAFIAMVDDDDVNYKACELVATHFGIPRIIVRLGDVLNADRFRSLGATVVDVNMAIVNVLAQYTLAPQTTAIFLHDDPNYEVLQLTIINPDIVGLALRDLHLPPDVLVLAISRDGQSVVPHGHSVIHLHDEITLVGRPKSLETLTVYLGF